MTLQSSNPEPNQTLRNTPYDQLKIGDKATYQRTLTERDLVLFATVSGDYNPVHLDESFAAGTQFGERIAHGMWTGSLISAALAMVMPGPGGIYGGQELKFLRPVKLGDTLTVELEVLEKNERRKKALIRTDVINQHGKAVVKGTAEVMPATEDVCVERAHLPHVSIEGM
ncbi:MAG: 3-hydroxybutyryl-CoA dehydratase [Oceanospirillales bacterium LUC14_002_19_P2]|nr:MAG: 3-hydroxybutyryl-CoA dehydratase [Oceanospirillales bacterium LUC14_002_19_P2]